MNSLELKEKRKLLGLTQQEMADKLGITSRTIINYEKGTLIPKSKAELFSRIFDELENKNVKSITENISVIEPKEQIPNSNGNIYEQDEDGKYRIFVKKVPVKAFGSYLTHFQDHEFVDELKQVSFPVSHVGRGNYICFEVEGESMNGGRIDDTKAGAELLCRELGRHHWKDGFKSNEYGWVIIHKDTVLFKDIKSLDLENGDMILSSRSGLPQHCDFTVSINDIRQIWKVIKRTQ